MAFATASGTGFLAIAGVHQITDGVAHSAYRMAKMCNVPNAKIRIVVDNNYNPNETIEQDNAEQVILGTK